MSLTYTFELKIFLTLFKTLIKVQHTKFDVLDSSVESGMIQILNILPKIDKLL